MKKGDLLVALILIITTLLSFMLLVPGSASEELTLVIKVNSEIYKEIKLTGNYNKLVEINSPFGYNKISIEGNSVKMVKSDCDDGLCIKEHKISKPFESLICLPARLIVYIEGESELHYVSY